jgi:hypothetical protein
MMFLAGIIKLNNALFLSLIPPQTTALFVRYLLEDQSPDAAKHWPPARALLGFVAKNLAE